MSPSGQRLEVRDRVRVRVEESGSSLGPRGLRRVKLPA
jgi:hypothetical protein